MKKYEKMGYWSIVLLTINSIIGSGIFISPTDVVKQAGTLTPVVYLCAAIFASVLAISFASASKYVVKGGAAYAYTKAAFGEKTGFYIGITRFVSASIAWGVMATAVVRTSLNIFKIEPTNSAITIGFLILMLILLFINMWGTRILTVISNLSTIGKLLALSITIIAGIVIVLKTGENHFSEIATVTGSDGSLVVPPMTVSVFVMSMLAAFYAFTGFESIASGSQDMEKPEVNLPRAIPVGIIIIAFFYIAIVGIAMMVNPVALATSKEVVILAAVFDNPFIKGLIIVGALVSMFGINVAASFHTPRVLESMAKEGQLSKFFDKRTGHDFPLRAFLLTAIVAIVVPISFDYKMGSIMVISSISRFVQFVMVPLAVIYFYRGKTKEPILDAQKNKITDVVLPIISIILTIFLLVKFDWVGQFSETTEIGTTVLNYKAITAMVFGYILIPVSLYYLKEFSQKRDA